MQMGQNSWNGLMLPQNLQPAPGSNPFLNMPAAQQQNVAFPPQVLFSCKNSCLLYVRVVRNFFETFFSQISSNHFCSIFFCLSTRQQNLNPNNNY